MVAHGIGGAVALGAHLQHGADYADLFLWDVVTLDPWGSPFFRLVAENPKVFPELPAALHAALVKEYIAGAARHQLTTEWVEALTQPWLGELGQPAFYRQIAALDSEHTRPVVERLHEVRCAVRIGWGAQDPWIPIAQAFELRARLPGSPLVIELERAGHLTPVGSLLGSRACQGPCRLRPTSGDTAAPSAPAGSSTPSPARELRLPFAWKSHTQARRRRPRQADVPATPARCVCPSSSPPLRSPAICLV